MGKIVDITGNNYGRLTVVRYHSTKNRIVFWECLCECGNTTIVRGNNVKRGGTKSCGCLRKEGCSKTHGFTNTRMHGIWCNMKQRCKNTNHQSYTYYGERGVTVCKEWEIDFMSFYNWANENGYEEHLTIDRIDNDGNYEPSNCRWATYKEQASNKSDNNRIEIDGVVKNVTQWSEFHNINRSTLNRRISEGWDKKDYFIKLNRRYIEINGVVKTMAQWARFYGIKYVTLKRRVYAGWDKKDYCLQPSNNDRLGKEG